MYLMYTPYCHALHCPSLACHVMLLFTIWFNHSWYITILILQLHVASVPYSALDCENEATYTCKILVQKQTVASEQCQFVGMCRPWQHLSFPTTAASSSTVLLVGIQSHNFATVLNLWLELWNARTAWVLIQLSKPHTLHHGFMCLQALLPFFWGGPGY